MAKTDCTKKCPVCASAVIGNKSKVYCSSECQQKAFRDRVAKTANCKNCGKEFKYNTNSNGWYCSHSCAATARAQLPETKERRREKQLLRRTGEHSPVYDRKCIECDTVYHLCRAKLSNPYCSSDCRKVWQERYKPFIIRSWKKAGILLSFKICPETGWIFKADNLSQKYASTEIAKRVGKRIAKAKRRARKRSNGKCDNIDPLAVFAQVDYVCQICGKQTDKTKRGTISWDAPELDHIMPLSKGGKHTLDNVQCACRRCNHAKSDTVMPLDTKGGICKVQP